ncbi:hypothetical protein CEXT_755131 [Caerostris extrusa]|uniref:Uncharacterized protein n=1 Tax=Caerostris extrusa TaxID=172846 RepID=A0AAV4UCT6_CAEEX|nr:hypothetical protein CEXT_755131 [Caerostris extrusa]
MRKWAANRYRKSHDTFDSSIFLTKTSLNPESLALWLYLVSQNGCKEKEKEKSERRRRRTEGRKKSNNCVFPGINVRLKLATAAEAIFPARIPEKRK